MEFQHGYIVLGHGEAPPQAIVSQAALFTAQKVIGFLKGFGVPTEKILEEKIRVLVMVKAISSLGLKEDKDAVELAFAQLRWEMDQDREAEEANAPVLIVMDWEDESDAPAPIVRDWEAWAHTTRY